MVKLEDCTDTGGSPNGEGGVSSTVGTGSSGLIPCAVPFVVKKVKLEDCADTGGSPNGEARVNSSIGAVSSGLLPRSVPVVVKEESFPSSSNSHFKSYLVGMGFSSVLVDKVIEENGEDDVNVLLEALLAQSVHLESSPASVSLSEHSSANKEEDSSPFEFILDDNENKFSRGNDDATSHVGVEKKSYLLMMDFTEEEIDLAISRLGENSSLTELVDFIIASQNAGSFGDKGMLGSFNSSIENEATAEALFGTMDKTLCLLRMGFTENEVSSAIANFGSEAPLDKLADSILASRLAFQVKEEDFSNDDIYFSPQELNEFEQLGCVKEENPVEFFRPAKPWQKNVSHSNRTFDDYEDNKILKKSKSVHTDGTGTSHWSRFQNAGRFECPSTGRGGSTEYGSTDAASIKNEVPDYVPHNISGSYQNMESKSPFYFYGNVADVSQDTWRKLSQFLHGTKPEFVNAQFFSALNRKEGYLHNLPIVGRFHIIPKPPMTIEDSLPHTKKWWPSWDTRKQLICINSETIGVDQLCNRLGRIMESSQGMISKEQQMDIIHHCKAMNLIWIGPNKLRPMEPEHLEQILGYPRHHTDIPGMELPGRLSALKYSFQTDTIGYHFSVLKSIYPDGLRLLSICSGIGGAEVALYRLGIRLRCVVSVETSESNKIVLKKWWNKTGQSGELRQIAGVEKLTIRQIEVLIKEFGGFDIIIGGNPGFFSTSSSNRDSQAGMHLNHFYEFTRVLHRVRSMMGRNPASPGRRN